jgi:hypothetical protein
MLKASIPNVLSVYCIYMLQVFQTYVVRPTFHSHLLAADGPVRMHVGEEGRQRQARKMRAAHMGRV